jgi:hypothetical protein
MKALLIECERLRTLSMRCSIQIVSHVITTHSEISEIISFSAPWMEYNFRIAATGADECWKRIRGQIITTVHIC